MRRDRFGIVCCFLQILGCFLVAGSPCPPGKNVTDEIAQDELMPVKYSAEQLKACLGVGVLERNLPGMSYYAWEQDQIDVIKEKLNETGYPESVLRNLGDFLTYMDPEDVKNWRFNSAETLVSLLANDPAAKLATEIIRQYTDSGGVLDAEALNATGTNDICNLDSEQLRGISENAIKGAKPLDISSCNQTTKDILYPTAKRAFSDRHNKNPGYYNLIKPYLGGAPAEDLKALSKYNISMDIDTFMQLKPESVMQLTPSTVKRLLGDNLKDLKGQENKALVKDWAARQWQRELDALGFGLRGGKPDGYINITPRQNNPPRATDAARGHASPLFSGILLTLLLTFFLS